MIKRLKGGGGLSRKLLTMLMAAAMPLSGALANDVYIEQIGDNALVSITQTGAGNLVNSGGAQSTDAALIKGDNNVVMVNQLGSANTLSLILNNESFGSGTNVNISADGSNNNQDVSCGTSLSDSCNATTITNNVTGNNNNTTQLLSGGVASSVINVNGSYNNVSHVATGLGLHTADITVAGSGSAATPNAVSLVQSGVSAKNASISSSGSNINIAIIQSD